MNYNDLLESYMLTDNTELEFRFQLNNRELFKKLLLNINGTKSIEQSINFISPGLESNRICQLMFVNGIKQHTTFMSKKIIKKTSIIDAPVPYKLVLSSEETIQKFDINVSIFARIKLRFSIRPFDLSDWRIDFTLVKTVKDIKNNLKQDKNKMLYELDIESFVKNAPWGVTDALELEVEHIGSNKNIENSNIEHVIEYITGSIDPNYKLSFDYQKAVYKIASVVLKNRYKEEFKHKGSIRQLYNRVIELNRPEYFKTLFPNIRNYYLLDKADGIRAMVIIEGNRLTALNGGIEIIELSQKHNDITVFDSEYIKDNEIKKYYIFDVLVYKGTNITDQPTTERVKYIPDIVKMIEGHGIAKTMIDLNDNYRKIILDLWEKSNNSDKYEVDGLIFTPKDANYFSMKSLKWKPLSHVSIDFLVKEAPSNIIGIKPYLSKEDHTLMFLFCGIGKQTYDKLRMEVIPSYKKIFPHQSMYSSFPIQFSPADNPFAYLYYHPNNSKIPKKDIVNNVCEFRRIDLDKDPKWELMRVRTDRKMDLEKGNYFGNGFQIAEYTWQNYQNPLTIDDLVVSSSDFMELGYFKEDKLDIYKHVTAFNSFVKSKILSNFKNSKWLIDLASGKGQDLFRVSDAKIKNALFMDSDSQALSELVSRKNNFQRGVKGLNTKIHTKRVDLTDDYESIIESIKQLGIPVGEIDVIMCNFAIHYLIGTPESIRNIINLINGLLKPGGHFFFTAFNGEKIFDMLKKSPSWDIREGEVLKYSIKKKFKSEKLMPTGQQIDVLLPFSNGNYYTEFLVNYKYLLGEFVENGFIVDKHNGFHSMLSTFKNESNKIYNKLSEDDIKFSGLYSYAILRKKR